jgi:N6-adenosine-specific RNA methylase IME4
VISCDFPWRYDNYGMKGHGAVRAHYPTMTIEQARDLPIASLAHPDRAALFMWACAPKLPEAIVLMRWWGFRYVTRAFTWKKTYDDGSPYCGLGSYTRSDTEDVLLGVRGRGLTKLRKSAAIRQTFEAPRREHSRKPDVIYERIEALLPGPYVELFARATRRGWDAWGNEPGVPYTIRLERSEKR